MSVIGKNVLSAAVVLLLLAGATRAQDKVIVWSAHPQGSDGTRAASPMEMVKQIDWLEIVINGQPGRRIIFTRLPAARCLVAAGTLIKAVALANATKSEEPPHFKGSASNEPFSSACTTAGR